ncbi:MAG: MFS transporter [Jatrophihabitans sp.]|uniref:MFS transporter n=1 Tax=Jatrophihabitans sp. TaxID=1932789 RepID=UPI003F7F47F8
MQRQGYLRHALHRPAFRRLLAVRLTGQYADGIFQASLAGAVLFNPERQGHAADIASSFAVLLVPYSLVGPFAGVLIDRWWRQRVLVRANVLRAAVIALVAGELVAGSTGVLYYGTALVAISISRFILATLSAGLPHVVPDDELVTANAITSTLGSIVTAIGGATAIAARAVIGDTNDQYAVIALLAAAVALGAAAAGRRFALDQLGPDETARRRRETLADVARGLRAGAAHIRSIPVVAHGLAVVGLHRIGYGLTLVCTVLLYRNYYAADGVVRAGLAGLSQVLAALAIGGGAAALVTPFAFRRLGPRTWITGALVGCVVLQVGFVLPYRLPLLLVGVLLLGFASQAIKISVDTIVQHSISDTYRGRVFSLYDAMVNLAMVAAAVLTAVVLPETGRSPTSVVVIAGLYLVMATAYAGVTAAARPTTV